METPDYIKGQWPVFGETAQFAEVECDDAAGGGSLAVHVLDTFGIPIDTSSSRTGGNLKDLDIKRMDALAVINLSLLETTAKEGLSNGELYELIINEDGEAEFIVVGQNYAALTDIYYQIQTDTYRERCSGILLRGGVNMPEWEPLDWKFIWGEGDNSSRKLYDMTALTTKCTYDNYSTHAMITYNDPHLDEKYNDGINGLYNLDDPFKKIMGYSQFIYAEQATPYTRIEQHNTSTIPIQIGDIGDTSNGPSMGTLIPKPVVPENTQDWAECWNDAGVDLLTSESQVIAYGVPIPIPDEMRFRDLYGTDVDKFVKVDKIMIKGVELNLVHSGPLTAQIAVEEEPSNENTITVISAATMSEGIFELEEGRHYTIQYVTEFGFKNPYVVFAKDARINEPKNFGQNSEYMFGNNSTTGYYKVGDTGTGTIFPVAENKGFLVTQIWALVTFETPCITIYDPPYNDAGDLGQNSSLASTIANELEYIIAPLIVNEQPPPIIYSKGYGAEEVDQAVAQQDNDPTTEQDFENTPLEIIMEEMSGGKGFETTLPFFKDDDIETMKDLAENLFYMMDEDFVETTYVCGPNTEVRLGEVGPGGGVVNSITYSYSDQGSYTISVNEGQKLLNNFSASGPTGPSFKASESVNMRGTIIESIGNGIHFKVRVDGFGEKFGLNMTSELLRDGDVVSCSIHNHPVED